MTHRLRTGALICACLGALTVEIVGAATPAAAATRVLGLHVDGDKLTPKDRADLFNVLQAKLRLYPDIELKNPPEGELTDEMIDLECIDLDADCLTKLAKKYQADRVIHVDVRLKRKKYVMRVRVADVTEAKLTRDRQIKSDDVAALAPVLEAEVEAVFGAPPPPPTTGLLIIEADSPDAVIQLGQDYMGTGTASAELAPGEYTVRITQVGFEPLTEAVVVRAGETTQRRFTLTPVRTDIEEPSADDDDDDWVIWAIVGAVVVGGAVTAVVVATGGDSDDTARGPAILGIDASSAWRDASTVGGRR